MAEPNVYVDPEKLANFAGQLGHGIAWYRRAIENTEGRLAHLGKTWRDDEFEAFRREFENTRRVVDVFLAKAEQARKDITADAERARAYQRIRKA